VLFGAERQRVAGLVVRLPVRAARVARLWVIVGGQVLLLLLLMLL